MDLDRLQLAISLRDREKFGASIDEFKDMLDAASDSAERNSLLLNIATCYGRIGNYREARRVLRQAYEHVVDGSSRCYTKLADALLLIAEGQEEKAVEELGKLAANEDLAGIDPDLAGEVHWRRGATLARLDRYAEALRDLEMALELDLEPEDRQYVQLFAGLCYDKVGERRKALAALEDAVAAKPGTPFEIEARYSLGILLYHEKAYAKSVENLQVCESALEKADIPPRELYRMLAELCVILGKKAEATHYAKMQAGS